MSLPLRGAVDASQCREHELLRRALVVVHFSPVLKIVDKTGAGIADFQDAVRGIYPQLDSETEQSLNVELVPDKGVQATIQENLVWNLRDADGVWTITLTSQSIGLGVAGDAYTSREDFSDRVRYLIAAVQEHFVPGQVTRIGVRYVNAEAVDGNNDPRKFCTRELVSISGETSVAEADLMWRFPVDEGTLLLRSGIVGQGRSYDPAMMPPAPQRCWYLDIDVFSEPKDPFLIDPICEAVDRQLLRIYEIYRWAIPHPIGQAT